MADLPQPILEVDLADDGAFATDISAYVFDVTLEWGRNSPLEKVAPRKATIILDNSDERFTPKNTSGPYSPDWRKDKPIRLKAKVPAVGVTNLIENPSLETDVVGWSAAGTFVQDTAQARYGKACGKLIGSVTPNRVRPHKRDGTRIAVTAALVYVYRVKVRAEGGASSWALKILWRDSGEALISATTGTLITLTDSGPWTELLVSGTAPALATQVDLQIVEDGSSFGVGEDLFLDGAMFYQSSDATLPYIDGDQPGATWSGTAHESTSSRGTDPIFAEILGFITDLKVERRGGEYTCTVQIVSARDYHLDRFVSQHNIVDHPIKLSFERLLDVLEGAELFKNPSFEDRVNGTTLPTEYSKVGTATGTTLSIVDQGIVAYDGVHMLDYVNALAAPVAGDGWRYDMTPVTSGGKEYRFALIIINITAANNGKQVAFRLVDDDGGEAVQATTLHTLTDSVYTYIVVKGTYRAGSTARYIELVANETFAASGRWNTDAHHGVLALDEILRDNRGSSTNLLKHVGAFLRSARALLDELADSAGGVIWEKGDGTLVLEDYLSRSATPVPKIRLTDSLELDGFSATGVAYGERQDHAYTEVFVYSDGDILELGSTDKDIWTLDPPLGVLGAGVTRTYFVTYPVAEVGGQIIGQGENVEFTLSAGSLTVDLKPFGIGAILKVTAGGSGADVTSLKIVGLLLQRQSARSRVSHTPSGAAARRFQRELRLDMPMQGHATAAMDAIAQRAGDNFLEGQDVIEATLEAATTEQWLAALGCDFGDPVHIRHNTGRGNLALDETYQIEGGRLVWSARPLHRMVITWTLSRASIQLITARRSPGENAEARQFARAAPSRRQPVT